MKLIKINILILFAIVDSRFGYAAEIYNDVHYKRVTEKDEYFPKWEFEDYNYLEYPRSDSKKLRQISKLWSKHYSCLSKMADTGGPLRGVATAAFEGSVARLPCGLCVGPDELRHVTWIYSKTPDSTFNQLHPGNHEVIDSDGNLTIHGLTSEHAGVYRCKSGRSVSGGVFLDIISSNEYDVVKPFTTEGPYPSGPLMMKVKSFNLAVYTSWSDWSECSSCGRVGRRRREGICFVNMFNNVQIENDEENEYTTITQNDKEDLNIKTEVLIDIFKDFPGGLPCNSSLLPQSLRYLTPIRQRRNEIMIGLCKIDCENATVFEVRTRNGAVLERANNTDGVYSLWQTLPTSTTTLKAVTLFIPRGQPVNITCPGIALKQIPLNWRVGTEFLNPRSADKESGGRVHLNARDQLVFLTVQYSDSNVYSCWQRDLLVGTVKLTVCAPPPTAGGHGAMLATLLLGAFLTLRLVTRLLHEKRRLATLGMAQVCSCD